MTGLEGPDKSVIKDIQVGNAFKNYIKTGGELLIFGLFLGWNWIFFSYLIKKRIARDNGDFTINDDGSNPHFDKFVAAGTNYTPFFSKEFVITFLLSAFLEYGMYYYAQPWIVEWYLVNLDPKMEDTKRKATAIKAGLTFNQLVKTSIMTVWGFLVLWGMDYVPKALGGGGGNLFDQLPYPDVRFATFEYYYPFTFLRYIFDFIYFPTRKKVLPKDFNVMCIHHMVTIYLVVGSYIIDYVNAGAITMHLHNISEPFLCLCRMSNGVPLFDALQLDVVFWLLMTFSWFYLRLIVWPINFVWPFLSEYWHNTQYGTSVLGVIEGVDVVLVAHQATIFWSCVSFVTLQVMHVFWFSFLLKIGKNCLTKGVKEDAISGVNTSDFAENSHKIKTQ